MSTKGTIHAICCAEEDPRAPDGNRYLLGTADETDDQCAIYGAGVCIAVTSVGLCGFPTDRRLEHDDPMSGSICLCMSHWVTHRQGGEVWVHLFPRSGSRSSASTTVQSAGAG